MRPTPAEHRLLLRLNPTIYHRGSVNLRYACVANDMRRPDPVADAMRFNETIKVLDVIRSEGLCPGTE